MAQQISVIDPPERQTIVAWDVTEDCRIPPGVKVDTVILRVFRITQRDDVFVEIERSCGGRRRILVGLNREAVMHPDAATRSWLGPLAAETGFTIDALLFLLRTYIPVDAAAET